MTLINLYCRNFSFTSNPILIKLFVELTCQFDFEYLALMTNQVYLHDISQESDVQLKSVKFPQRNFVHFETHCNSQKSDTEDMDNEDKFLYVLPISITTDDVEVSHKLSELSPVDTRWALALLLEFSEFSEIFIFLIHLHVINTCRCRGCCGRCRCCS